MLGASPGGFGTILAQTAWLPVLRVLGLTLWTGARVTVARARTVFDAEGHLTDEKMREQLRLFADGFATFVAERRRT